MLTWQMWTLRLQIFTCVCSYAEAFGRVSDKHAGHQGPDGSHRGHGSSKRMAGSAGKVWTGTQVTSALGKPGNFSVPLWWFNISQKFRPWTLCIPNSRIPGDALKSLQAPFARDSRKDHAPQQQSMVFQPVLFWLAQELLHEQSPVGSVQRLAVFQGPTWNQSSSMSQDREGLESGCALGYTSSKPHSS